MKWINAFILSFLWGMAAAWTFNHLNAWAGILMAMAYLYALLWYVVSLIKNINKESEK